MILGGFQKNSLIDFPTKVASVAFTQGCNFRCFYCYNKNLWPRKKRSRVGAAKILAHLKTRRGKIDGAVITGGEPTLQPGLLGFMMKIKKMGFLVKLDSNGSMPEVLARAFKEKLVDYLAMDIKGPLEKYAAITGVKVNLRKIQDSIELIKKSGVPYEFRTTFCAPDLVEADLKKIAVLLGDSKKYILQDCFLGEALKNKRKLADFLNNYHRHFPKILECFIR